MSYCRACRVDQLARYPGWNAGSLADDAIVFLHDDFVVSADAARMHIVFKDPSTAWQAFAAGALERPLHHPAGGTGQTQQPAGVTTTHTGN